MNTVFQRLIDQSSDTEFLCPGILNLFFFFRNIFPVCVLPFCNLLLISFLILNIGHC